MSYYLQEDGTSKFLLEDGSGFYLLEGAATPTLTDTGVAVTDSLVSLRARSLTDTGTTVSDSIAAASSGHVAATDTGAAISDSLTKFASKLLSDTGASVSETVTKAAGKVLADAGVNPGDALAKTVARFLIDTAMVLSDSAGAISTSTTGLSISDSLRANAGRHVADTGCSITDALRIDQRVFVASVGTTVTDSISKVVSKTMSDTLTFSDSLGRHYMATPSDTGLTVSDATQKTAKKVVTDTGLSFSEALVVRKNGGDASVNIGDTGLAIVATVAKSALLFRAIADAFVLPEVGLNLTEGILVQVNGAPPGSCTNDFRRFLLDLDASPEYMAWCSTNPGDCSTWTTYAAAILGGGTPSPPAMSTDFGGALVDVGIVALEGIVPCRAKPPPITSPHAAFSFAVSGLTVAFTNLSTPGASGLFDSWLWDFGDGNTDTTTWSPSHTYAGSGTYTVTLTVVGADSDGISSVRHLVKVFVPSTRGIHIDAVIV